MTSKTARNFKANSATELVKQNYGKDFMTNRLSKAWITVKKQDYLRGRETRNDDPS